MLSGGTAWIYALFVAISAATGWRFAISGDGGGRGIPLPDTWFHAALFTGIGALLWLAGGRWDREGFVAFRRRRPWVVPVIVAVVIVPATLVLIFLLVR